MLEAIKEAVAGLTHPSFWWTLAGIVMLFFEMLIPGLVIFFFGVGALVTALVCLVAPGLSVTWQLLLFLVFSLTALFSLRRWLKRVFTGQTTRTGELSDSEAEFVGERAVTVTEIPAGRRGKITFHGTRWAAESEEVIGADVAVEIVGKRSTILKVRAVETVKKQSHS